MAHIKKDSILLISKAIKTLRNDHNKKRTRSTPELDTLGTTNLNKVLNKLWNLQEGGERDMLHAQLTKALKNNGNNFYDFINVMKTSLQWKGMSAKDFGNENVTLESLVIKAETQFSSINNDPQLATPRAESADSNNESQAVKRPITSMQNVETGRAIKSSTGQTTKPDRDTAMEDIVTGKATRTRPKSP